MSQSARSHLQATTLLERWLLPGSSPVAPRHWTPLVVALIAVLLELVIRRAVAALVLVPRRELLIDGVGCLVS